MIVRPSSRVDANWQSLAGTPSTSDSQVPHVPASQPRSGRSDRPRNLIAHSAEVSDQVANESCRSSNVNVTVRSNGFGAMGTTAA
jgi:hypothetical protein